jgi:hypothetical protein
MRNLKIPEKDCDLKRTGCVTSFPRKELGMDSPQAGNVLLAQEEFRIEILSSKLRKASGHSQFQHHSALDVQIR